MKDLLFFVADADAEGFMRGMLNRPQAFGIRFISFDIDRHPLRDSGMVQTGAELTRTKKGKYQKAILMLDHHGSGRDLKQSHGTLAAEIQGKLDAFTWRGNSFVSVFVPELEQWLWYSEKALCSYFKISPDQLQSFLEERSRKLIISVDSLKSGQPKELFEFVIRDCLRRTISPRDFSEIGKVAGIRGLMNCDSFRSIVQILRAWFPE